MATNIKRRVGEADGPFRLLTQQIKVLHRDLVAFQKRTGRRFDRIDARFDSVHQKLDRLDGKLDSLDRKMPDIICDALSDYTIKSKKA